MRIVWCLAKRELFGFFNAPVGYVVFSTFPAILALFFFVIGDFFAEGEASLRNFFSLMPFTLALLCPAITMKMWSEETREGTEELLRTWPIATYQLVLGKFCGAFGLLILALIGTAFVPFTVSQLGSLDWGPVIGGYFGSLLFGSVSLSVGLCFSAATRYQTVAWLGASVLLFSLTLIGMASTASGMTPMVSSILLSADLSVHFYSMGRGVIDLSNVLFFFSLSAVFLCSNGLLLERRMKG